jgi:5-formyltetrahydrofolate cyclo-ligase
MSKEEFRKHFTARRKAIPAATAEKLSASIAKNIFSMAGILASDLIMVYHRTGSEVDTAALTDIIIGSGRGIALPYCREDGTIGIGRVFNPHADLTPGAFGIMEPVDRLKDNVNAEHLGAVVCPGTAFDENGVRLGRGGGYYDKFLRWLKGEAFIIGCAFDCQISATPLPRDEHDIPMDAVVTEKRAFPEGACPALIVPERLDEE